MDQVSRLALTANNQTTTLEKGQTVHVDGVPYELLDDVEAFSATKPRRKNGKRKAVDEEDD